MRDFGVDGVFMQRLFCVARSRVKNKSGNIILKNALAASKKYDRAIGVMYDLSGLRAGADSRDRDDRKRLQSEMQLAGDPAYLHHESHPVVAIWGIGFSDDREYTLSE